MRTLVLAAFLALTAHMGTATDINVGDVTYKTAFAATSGDLYRSTLSIFSSWTTNSPAWSSLATTGYARVRHCYTGTNLYMVAIRTSGALRVVKYSITDDGSNAGEPVMVSAADFTTGAMSSGVSGVFCNKGNVFVLKNADPTILYYHADVSTIVDGSAFSTLNLNSGTSSCSTPGLTTSMAGHDLFVADGDTTTTYKAYLSTDNDDKSVFKVGLSMSSNTLSVTSCMVSHNAGDGVTRLHVDTGLLRMYYFDSRTPTYSLGVLSGENKVKYVSTSGSSTTTSTSATTVATITDNSGNNDCYDVLVSDDIVWVACQFGTTTPTKYVKKVTDLSPTSPDDNFENIGSGGLSTMSGLQTISVYDPSSSSVAMPSAVSALVCALAALFGARRLA